MEIVEVNGFMAHCQTKGVERDVSLFLLQDEPVASGDFVVVHLGYATQRVTEPEARAAWALYHQMLAAEGALSDA